MLNHSYLSNADVDSIEHLYEQYKTDKFSLDESWQRFFEGFDLAYGDLVSPKFSMDKSGEYFRRALTGFVFVKRCPLER